MATPPLRKFWDFFGPVLLAFLVLSTIFYLSRQSGQSHHELMGKAAPDIEFTLPGGKRSSIAKQRGRVLLINFWAAWCGPCLIEMPSLRALEQKFPDSELGVFAFHVEGETEASKQDWRSHGFPKNLVFKFDPRQLEPYRVSTIPLTVLVDKQGVFRKSYFGPRDWTAAEALKDIEGLGH